VSGLKRLNAMPAAEAHAALLQCCGAERWAEQMTARRPFVNAESVYVNADKLWGELSDRERLEAFAAHPRIGERHATAGGEAPARWSAEEQSRAASADADTLAQLAVVNGEYEARFGHVYLVFATGRSAAELLADARSRMKNDARTELAVAAEEHRRITRLRLARLLGDTG
jgi:OHCU decarboxylase